jgi:hypothetical protein
VIPRTARYHNDRRGQATSIYLSDDLVAAIEGSGVPLAELIRRGLGAALPPGSRPQPLMR